MSWKKEIDRPLDTEQANDLELDETPKPTRKVSNPSRQSLTARSQARTTR